MSRSGLVPKEESCEEMEANQASLAAEEIQWTWKREACQTKMMNINLFSRRSIVKQIAEELRHIGDWVYQEFLNSCFGFLMRFDTQGLCPNTVLPWLFAREVIRADAGPDELWYRVGGHFIRFSKYEYALVTGLSFGPTTFDPSAEHHPPANGLFMRHYRGQRLTMDALRSNFIDGVFHESPADALKVAKLLIVYYLLFGMDGARTYIDKWAWTLIEDTDRWESFMWGKYTYQILLRYLQRVPTELLSSEKPAYCVYGYVWAFLIWAFEAMPELGIVCGVPTFADVLPRCLRWRFLKTTQVDTDRFYDCQIQVWSTLEPSAEELRQPYWEHIHDDLRSGVCCTHLDNPFKKTATSLNLSSRYVLPVSWTQRSRATPTRLSHSTSVNPMELKKKRKRADPVTTCRESGQEKSMQMELSLVRQKLSLVQQELSLVRQELPSVIQQEVQLALKEFLSRRDSPPPAHTTTKGPAIRMKCDGPEVGTPIVPPGFEKYKCVDTMVVKMGREIEELRQKQLEADKVVEELKCKNLETNLKRLESDKAVELYKRRLENLLPKSMNIEEEDLSNLVNDACKPATSEGGNLDFQNFRGEEDSSGKGPNGSTPIDAENMVVMSGGVLTTFNSSGRRSSGLSKKENLLCGKAKVLSAGIKEGKGLKSDIFTKHFQKIEIVGGPPPEDGKKRYRVICNHCQQQYAFKKGGGYGNMHTHLNNKHPDKVRINQTQTQLRAGGGQV